MSKKKSLITIQPCLPFCFWVCFHSGQATSPSHTQHTQRHKYSIFVPMDNSKYPIKLTQIVRGNWGAHADMWGAKTFLLWGDNADHRGTVLPERQQLHEWLLTDRLDTSEHIYNGNIFILKSKLLWQRQWHLHFAVYHNSRFPSCSADHCCIFQVTVWTWHEHSVFRHSMEFLNHTQRTMGAFYTVGSSNQ